jgi:hypothetical protein
MYIERRKNRARRIIETKALRMLVSSDQLQSGCFERSGTENPDRTNDK